jgi:hypothetical protein
MADFWHDRRVTCTSRFPVLQPTGGRVANITIRPPSTPPIAFLEWGHPRDRQRGFSCSLCRISQPSNQLPVPRVQMRKHRASQSLLPGTWPNWCARDELLALSLDVVRRVNTDKYVDVPGPIRLAPSRQIPKIRCQRRSSGKIPD